MAFAEEGSCVSEENMEPLLYHASLFWGVDLAQDSEVAPASAPHVRCEGEVKELLHIAVTTCARKQMPVSGAAALWRSLGEIRSSMQGELRKVVAGAPLGVRRGYALSKTFCFSKRPRQRT